MVVTHPEAVLVKTASYFRTSKPRMWFLAQRRSRANNNWSCDSSGLTLDNVYTFFEVEVTSEQGTLTSSPLAKKQINATNVAITIRIDNSMMFSLRTNTMHVNWQCKVFVNWQKWAQKDRNRKHVFLSDAISLLGWNLQLYNRRLLISSADMILEMRERWLGALTLKLRVTIDITK